MIRFTIGIVILAFAAIVGTYKAFENADRIRNEQNRLQSNIQNRDKVTRIRTQLQSVGDYTMQMGHDQKNNIERQLEIGGSTGLRFDFVGQPSSNAAAPGLYYHTFRVTGVSAFSDVQRLLTRMATNPGYVPYRVCYNCNRTTRDLSDNQQFISIEGYLYVYNPQQVF